VCLDGGLVSRGALLENCEGEFLEELSLVRSATDFKKKEVRVNTKVVYNQQKFNLLREESEGYAKVLTVLNNGGDAALSAATLPAVVRALQALIGFFDLDPNRVFDLVLDRYGPARRTLLRARQGLAQGALMTT
jgi:THO complex subunit 2